MSDLAAAVTRALAEVPARRHIQSIVVVSHGDVVLEQYFRDRRAEDLSNLHSVTKSVLATLTGIAIGEGLLDLETTLGGVLPAELFDDPRKAAITVRQLLTMTSGLEPESPHDIDEIADRGESWIAGPLAAPLRAEPGSTFLYNNGAAHVLGVLLARATSTPLARFAADNLFRPLGFEQFRWPADPEGNPLGYGHLELRPRDLGRLGELYLRGGRAGGTQLVPESFVAAATTAATDGGLPESVPYGYLWWIAEDAGHPSFFAGGYGGQYVTVIRDLELVVVTTGDVDVLTDTSRNLRRLVAEVVIPTLPS